MDMLVLEEELLVGPFAGVEVRSEDQVGNLNFLLFSGTAVKLRRVRVNLIDHIAAREPIPKLFIPWCLRLLILKSVLDAVWGNESKLERRLDVAPANPPTTVVLVSNVADAKCERPA